eukprot:8017856-Lingulodinium_polyedra.AAC.2
MAGKVRASALDAATHAVRGACRKRGIGPGCSRLLQELEGVAGEEDGASVSKLMDIAGTLPEVAQDASLQSQGGLHL